MLLGASFALLSLGACKKDDDDHDHPAVTANDFTIEFEHLGSNDSVLVLNSKVYTDSANEPYAISALKYYVSNVQLTRTDGTIWQEPNSYHLIEVKGAPNDNPDLTLKNVPLGNYKRITFAIGVDPIANGRTDQVGDLDPANDMSWGWNTGYKFLKLEGYRVLGTRPDTATDPTIMLHVGTNALYRPVTLELPTVATVTNEIAPQAHLAVDVNSILGGANVITLGNTGLMVMMGSDPVAKQLADNYAKMFGVEHVHNDAHQH